MRWGARWVEDRTRSDPVRSFGLARQRRTSDRPPRSAMAAGAEPARRARPAGLDVDEDRTGLGGRVGRLEQFGCRGAHVVGDLRHGSPGPDRARPASLPARPAAPRAGPAPPCGGGDVLEHLRAQRLRLEHDLASPPLGLLDLGRGLFGCFVQAPGDLDVGVGPSAGGVVLGLAQQAGDVFLGLGPDLDRALARRGEQARRFLAEQLGGGALVEHGQPGHAGPGGVAARRATPASRRSAARMGAHLCRVETPEGGGERAGAGVTRQLLGGGGHRNSVGARSAPIAAIEPVVQPPGWKSAPGVPERSGVAPLGLQRGECVIEGLDADHLQIRTPRLLGRDRLVCLRHQEQGRIGAFDGNGLLPDAADRPDTAVEIDLAGRRHDLAAGELAWRQRVERARA